eukprot:11973160-Ditylum_brightwellii.AAC.1
MAPISTQNNPGVKRAVIAFQQPQARDTQRVDQVLAQVKSSVQSTERYAGTSNLRRCKGAT